MAWYGISARAPTPVAAPHRPVLMISPCTVTLATALFASMIGSKASAAEPGTPEQRRACTPDVFRLCGEQIPDTNRIVACLRQNTPQLSDPCRAVFESNASVAQQALPQQPPPARRGDPQRRSADRY